MILLKCFGLLAISLFVAFTAARFLRLHCFDGDEFDGDDVG